MKNAVYRGTQYLVRESVVYMAVDADGSLLGFTEKPELGHGFWFPSRGDLFHLAEGLDNGGWQDSLVELDPSLTKAPALPGFFQADVTVHNRSGDRKVTLQVAAMNIADARKTLIAKGPMVIDSHYGNPFKSAMIDHISVEKLTAVSRTDFLQKIHAVKTLFSKAYQQAAISSRGDDMDSANALAR